MPLYLTILSLNGPSSVCVPSAWIARHGVQRIQMSFVFGADVFKKSTMRVKLGTMLSSGPRVGIFGAHM